MARMTQLAGIAIERRMAESALRASEARYRRLFDNVMEGVYSSTREGRFLSVNPALARMVGFSSPTELLSLPHGNDLSRTRRSASPSSRRSSATARSATPSSSCVASTARR